MSNNQYIALEFKASLGVENDDRSTASKRAGINSCESVRHMHACVVRVVLIMTAERIEEGIDVWEMRIPARDSGG